MKPFCPVLLIGLALVGALSATYADPVKPDPRAVALLQKEAAAVQAVHSLTADYEETSQIPTPSGTSSRTHSGVAVTLMRPNYARLVLYRGSRSPQTGRWRPSQRLFTRQSDGSSLMTLEADDTYRKVPSYADGSNIHVGFVEPLMDFFDSQNSFASQTARQNRMSQLRALRFLGKEMWNGDVYQVVEWRFLDPDINTFLTAGELKRAPGGVVVETDRLYIGADGLIHRVFGRDNVGWVTNDTLQNVRINPRLTRASFALKLPADAHMQAPPPPLLADGTRAPDFTVQDRDGRPVKLSDYRGKVVVLDFWATWCGPCQSSLPHTESVAEQFKDKNVTVLAVNVWDTKAAFQAWLPQHREYSALQFAIDPAPTGRDVASALYHVSAIPTQYVIGPDGRIARSFVGYGGPTGDLARAVTEALKGASE